MTEEEMIAQLKASGYSIYKPTGCQHNKRGHQEYKDGIQTVWCDECGKLLSSQQVSQQMQFNQ